MKKLSKELVGASSIPIILSILSKNESTTRSLLFDPTELDEVEENPTARYPKRNASKRIPESEKNIPFLFSSMIAPQPLQDPREMEHLKLIGFVRRCHRL